jgi:phospholipid/cholesterol/gamma-HCH transport system ATP-binding protein
VVGGSGTGKSVLMRSIIGLQRPRRIGRGAGREHDRPARGRGQEHPPPLGHPVPERRLFSTLTVAENVQVPIREYFPRIRQPLLDEIAGYKIVMSGLPENAGAKFPSELSGGMRKRAGLARALALDPNCCSWTSRRPASTPSARRRSTS